MRRIISAQKGGNRVRLLGPSVLTVAALFGTTGCYEKLNGGGWMQSAKKRVELPLASTTSASPPKGPTTTKALENARAANNLELEQRILQLLPEAIDTGEDPRQVLLDVDKTLEAYGDAAAPKPQRFVSGSTRPSRNSGIWRKTARTSLPPTSRRIKPTPGRDSQTSWLATTGSPAPRGHLRNQCVDRRVRRLLQ